MNRINKLMGQNYQKAIARIGLNKTLAFLILVFAFTIPISQFFSVRLLFCICLLSVSFQDLGRSSLSLLKNAWDIGLYLIVLTIGLLYSEDISMGLKVLETSFSLFAIPIIFSRTSQSEKDQFYNILLSFCLGLVLISLLCLAAASLSFYHYGDSKAFFFYQLVQQSDLQPTYLAYYLCFAITLGLYFLYYEITRLPPWILVSSIILLFIVLMLTAGRTSYISMLLTFSFFILKFFFEEKANAAKTKTFFISIILLIGMLAVNHFDLNTRSYAPSENNDYWERLILWKAALKANPDFLFGVGTGDYKKVLNEYFLSHGLIQYAKSSYNSHNQFIESLFSNGLIGLLSLIFLIGRPLYLAVRHQNVLGILVFFPFLIYGVTEVFLGRYQGVVFFSLLHQCFISRYNSKEI